MIKGITFDCAGTLVEVRQGLGSVLLGCASDLGVPASWKEAGIFEALYVAALDEFHAANRQGKAAVRDFYIRLASRWLSQIGADPGLAETLQDRVEAAAFGSDSPMFKPYGDALPCLKACREKGLKVGVISNWDLSLHDVLKLTGLSEYVDFAVASLEFGVEKPDPSIYDFALEHLKLRRTEVAHVGDDYTDDVQGALGAGLRPVFLDRGSPTVLGQSIKTLADLFRELQWTV